MAKVKITSVAALERVRASMGSTQTGPATPDEQKLVDELLQAAGVEVSPSEPPKSAIESTDVSPPTAAEWIAEGVPELGMSGEEIAAVLRRGGVAPATETKLKKVKG